MRRRTRPHTTLSSLYSRLENLEPGERIQATGRIHDRVAGGARH